MNNDTEIAIRALIAEGMAPIDVALALGVSVVRVKELCGLNTPAEKDRLLAEWRAWLEFRRDGWAG